MGFCNLDTTNQLYSMVTPTFLKVDDAKQFSLKDLSVTGYSKSEVIPPLPFYQGGCGLGAFEMMVLKNDGNPNTERTFYWIDCKMGMDPIPTVYEAGWYKMVGDNPVKMTDAEVAAEKFDLGQAFWIKGSGYKLVSAGAVSPQRMEFKTDDKLYVAAGNGMPVDCTLGDLYVNGYDPSEVIPPLPFYQGGCGLGQFELMILKNDGNPEQAYYWIDCKMGMDPVPTVYEAGWYKMVDDNPVKMNAEELAAVKIKAGQGFWIAGTEYNLVVPSPLTEKKDAE